MPNTLCFFSMNPGLSPTQPACTSLLPLHAGIPPLMTGDNLLSLPIFSYPPIPLTHTSPPSRSLFHRLPWDIALRAPLNKCKHTGPRGSPVSTNTHTIYKYSDLEMYTTSKTNKRTVRWEPPETSCWHYNRTLWMFYICGFEPVLQILIFFHLRAFRGFHL